MITAPDFELIELLSREALERHPVWADYREGADRARVLGWGVERGRLDAEIAKYDYCGRSPLFPVLAVDAARARAGLGRELANPCVAMDVGLPDGVVLPGYSIGGRVHGVFTGDGEICINPVLPARAQAEALRLAAALGRAPSQLWPLCFEPRAEAVALLGEPVAATLRHALSLEVEADPR